MKNNDIKLLIIAYFTYTKNWDITEIKDYIGIQYIDIEKYLLLLFKNGYLKTVDINITVTLKGRILLSNSYLEEYKFNVTDCDIEKKLFKKRMHINEVYVPDFFLEEEWWGSK